jgi:hypothetical protein
MSSTEKILSSSTFILPRKRRETKRKRRQHGGKRGIVPRKSVTKNKVRIPLPVQQAAQQVRSLLGSQQEL